MAARIIIVLAGLMGAAGVGLAAAAAHMGGGSVLDSAANMLLFHAASVLAGVALLEAGRLWRPAALLALVAWVFGAALFASDIAMRTFEGSRLFPMAAPIGGSTLIAGWVALVLAGAKKPRPTS